MRGAAELSVCESPLEVEARIERGPKPGHRMTRRAGGSCPPRTEPSEQYRWVAVPIPPHPAAAGEASRPPWHAGASMDDG